MNSSNEQRDTSWRQGGRHLAGQGSGHSLGSPQPSDLLRAALERGRHPLSAVAEILESYDSAQGTGDWFYCHVGWLNTKREEIFYSGETGAGAQGRAVGHVDNTSRYYKPYFRVGRGRQVAIIQWPYPADWSKKEQREFERVFVEFVGLELGQCVWNKEYLPYDSDFREWQERRQAALLKSLARGKGLSPWTLTSVQFFLARGRWFFRWWLAINITLMLFVAGVWIWAGV